MVQIAVRLTIDGSIESNINSNSSTESSSLRHRLVGDNSEENINNSDNNQLSENNNNNNNLDNLRVGTQLTLWSYTRFFTFPFAFIYDTILSIFRFVLSIIRTDPIRSEIFINHLNSFHKPFKFSLNSLLSKIFTEKKLFFI